MNECRCKASKIQVADLIGDSTDLRPKPANAATVGTAVLSAECHSATECPLAQGHVCKGMRFQFQASDLTPHGLEIGILRFKDSPANDANWPSQIFVEYYQGKVRVHVWNGCEDPVVSVEIDPISA